MVSGGIIADRPGPDKPVRPWDKAVLCSPQSLNRAVEVVRAGMTAGRFPSAGVGIRAATALLSDGAANKEWSWPPDRGHDGQSAVADADLRGDGTAPLLRTACRDDSGVSPEGARARGRARTLRTGCPCPSDARSPGPSDALIRPVWGRIRESMP